MASKVRAKLETVPFPQLSTHLGVPQGKKLPSDIVVLADRNDGINQTLRQRNINVDRVAQLELNMKFLQEQHQATLVALHQEVESLRRQNRDLQFELVFSKFTCVSSTPSSPEDNGTGFAKSRGSPVSVNVTPLQVELLEKDLQDTKTSLQEAKTQNQYLSEIIEQQKKKLDLSKEEKPKLSATTIGIQVRPRVDLVPEDFAASLDDSKAMVRRLRKQNKDQRKEIFKLKAAAAKGPAPGKSRVVRDTNSNHDNPESPTSTTQEQTCHKLPPLLSQSYWNHKMSRSDHNSDYRRNERSRHHKQNHPPETDGNVLPQLRNGSVQTDTGIGTSQPAGLPARNNGKYRARPSKKCRPLAPRLQQYQERKKFDADEDASTGPPRNIYSADND